MTIEDYTALAMDAQSFLCYISDYETYELLYANKAAKLAFGFDKEESFLGKKCFKILQNRDKPCELCNNDVLEVGKNAPRNMFVELTKANYSFIDTLIEINNKKARLTIAIDNTSQHEYIDSLNRKLSLESTLLNCIQTLVDDEDVDTAIHKLLALVGSYYESVRSYIYEIDDEGDSALNTYEWCADQSYSVIESRPRISRGELEIFLEAFKEKGEFAVENLSDLERDTSLYHLLKVTNTRSLLLTPLYDAGKVTSYIGVDNPKANLKDLSLLHSVSIFVQDDIKKRRLVKQLEYLSYTDNLTGFYNRNKFILRIDELELESLVSLGVITVNLNGLKSINELYGQQYGDYILKQLSEIFKKFMLDDVYRLAGDEFVIFCKNINFNEFELLVSALRKEDELNQELSYAIGDVWQEGRGINITQALSQSNELMFADKQKYYQDKPLGEVKSRSNHIEILIDEIKSGLFTVYLQPKVELTSNKVIGAEALIRKIDINGKIIPPDRFIPIYEHEGTVRHIDFFVLDKVCSFLKEMLAKGRAIKIAVNFSRVTFMSTDLVNEIVRTCAKYSVPHEYVKIEITESIDKLDFEFFAKKLKSIKDAGFDISLDDFGAMHSNLLMLAMTEFSEVKIDKRLVDNIISNKRNAIVVRNIVKTIKEIGSSACVAEGIETVEQKEMLQEFGCFYGQGYYFNKPLDFKTFLDIYDDDI